MSIIALAFIGCFAFVATVFVSAYAGYKAGYKAGIKATMLAAAQAVVQRAKTAYTGRTAH